MLIFLNFNRFLRPQSTLFFFASLPIQPRVQRKCLLPMSHAIIFIDIQSKLLEPRDKVMLFNQNSYFPDLPITVTID